jgi:hypothetical protein
MRASLIVFLLLLLPAAAFASRGPTAGEKAGIKSAVKNAKELEGAGCFHPTNIKVSTKGPWAIASVRNCSDANDVIAAIFSKKHGKWKARQFANGTLGCGIAPKKVLKDLDLFCP